MKTCPKCGNEISDGLFNKTKKCFFCDNPDFSEKAMELLDYNRNKVNCTSCGALMKIQDAHGLNPLFYKFSKPLKVGRFDWVHLCKKCDSEITITPNRDFLKKITGSSKLRSLFARR